MENPGYVPQVFRHDQPQIIAKNIARCDIVGGMLSYYPSGYSAGQVMAQLTGTNQWTPYVNSGSSGQGTALGVLLEVPSPDNTASGLAAGRIVTHGEVFAAKLVGFDIGATGASGLNAKTYVDFTGNTILSF